jgi:cytochrome c oxidase subunit III
MQGSISDKTQINIETDTHGSHHEAHPDFRIFGLIVFLVAEGMIFLGLFIAYLAFRSMAPGINTVILLSSSLVIHQADTAIKKNDVKGLQLWFGLTALMGIIFLGGQLYEYSHLEFGLRTNLFASTFYVLTGFHGLHVTVGVLLILSVLWRSMKPEHYGTNNHFGVEAAEIYWHFVDVIWVLLFILLYLL